MPFSHGQPRGGKGKWAPPSFGGGGMDMFSGGATNAMLDDDDIFDDDDDVGMGRTMPKDTVET